MKLMHCDLQHYIKESTSTPKVSTDKVVSIALGVTRGLKYLHGLTMPVVHRDISLKNILLTEDGHPKIAGFRVAKVLTDGREACASLWPGASSYAAPETYQDIKNNKAKYGAKVAIYSFGVTLLATISLQENPGRRILNFPIGQQG
ncbi:cysteine-rich receptor-like protein kinase 27 isoform X1 [Actinia tenebrosa]|uniref:Cysteine-rich receptor-like protein kinase 27 isoform X1 n=1 Tax=Actinia tenebrosa TaxID=6105 RepID=A0A6P8J3D3_ACTTE|nr:cysteine-rich receptor-like protein kinase 27 isoform X1 [Actinia tenebrosa]